MCRSGCWRILRCRPNRSGSPVVRFYAPHILEVTGQALQPCSALEAKFFVKIITGDLESYNRILTEFVLKAPEVASVHSGIVLEEIKHTTALPLPQHARK